jgi:histidinol phosphatase-like PHP family hydrolase
MEYLKAAGVPVCINTDSHKTDTIDFGLDSSMAYAKKAGYDELSYPVEGKIVHIIL